MLNTALRNGANLRVAERLKTGAFTMRSLGFTGVALAVLALATPSIASADSGIGAPPVSMPGGMRAPMVQTIPGGRSVLPHRGPFIRPQARYIAPSYGYQLPRTWMAPTYFIGNWGGFGLARPAPGFGWSRYYDDAVLTDQWGRIYDWRQDMRWDSGIDEGFDDGAYDDRQGDYMDRRGERRGRSGIGGAVVGAVVGGVAGNVIGGRGNRLPGTLIGGGLGALAGQAIDRGSRRHHHRDRDDRDGRRDGRRDRGDGYDRGGWSSGPHWGGGSWGSSSSSWSGGGYDTGGTTVTTVVIQPSAPVMQTRTVTSYEYVTVRKRRAVRHYRPRPKPACVCGS
jgi:Glycine zipper 2TM domain/Nickel/cobalt transporter regulator